MAKLVLATRNAGKMRELRGILAPSGIEVVGLDAFDGVREVAEDGDTFEANALLKARAAAEDTGLPALADDSGLEVAALDGRPGLLSARFGGPGLSDADRCLELLGALRESRVERSPARFVCVAALIDAAGGEHLRRAEWAGEVHGPPTGALGFGYDPIFWLPDRPVTAAMLPPDEKNRLSHRGRAFAAMRRLLVDQPGLLSR